jgi:hypothetical protein
MPPGALTKTLRKLPEKLDGRDVYATELVNDDLDTLDEMFDEYAELEREKADLDAQIRECEDTDERKELRAKARGLAHDMRQIDLRMLSLYIEDKDGNDFADDVLAKVPVRVQTKLTNSATDLIHGRDEGPTPGASDAP